MKKYEFTGEEKVENGVTLRRIRRLSDGLIGGWIESEDNLSHDGDCFVYGSARVCDLACVCDSARVCDSACVCDLARVCDSACVYGSARVCGSARVITDVMQTDDIVCIGPIGSRGGCTTYNTRNNMIVCGCWHGTLAEFDQRVRKEKTGLHAIQYMAAIRFFIEVKK